MILGSSGNVSLRFGTGMIITPTGGGPEDAAADTMVLCGFDSPAPGASSEWALHAAVYRDAPGAGAIVHTHSDACTALSALREGLPAFHYMLAGFGGAVRCAPYVTFGTAALARATADAMRDRSACLLANHGMVVHAAGVDRAVQAARTLEALARQYLMARAAGPVHLLNDAELDAARERFTSYGRAERQPAQSQPAQSQPAQSQPAQSQPAQNQPAQNGTIP